jgi:hypothetical protein
VVAYRDTTGQWQAGTFPLDVQGPPQAPQAPTPEQEQFAQPTMNFIELIHDWIRQWVVDQFPLVEMESGPDGRRRFSFNCISDEIITAKYEIGNSGIYALASAECWYEQDGQQRSVLVPLVITDFIQMVIAGFGIQDYNPIIEEAGNDFYSGHLRNAGVWESDIGHIFSPLVSRITPEYVTGTNQGLGNEQLDSVFTEQMLVEFATGNGDTSVLPKVVINGVEYSIFWSGQIGIDNHTLNNNNPYAQ